MTIEEKEAIKLLEWVLEDGTECEDLQYHGVPIKKALNIVIKALKKQPSENCISRQEAIEQLYQVYDVLLDAERKIKELPPAASEQKTGHWTKYGVPRCGEQHYKCTFCGYCINFGQWGEFYTREFKYCPNCGVKMEDII